ncbi:peroxisomal carnitine O-octanoyltransferase-like [Uloborus diversus]|uniref:peroxisomal carnitine O-octanoyltransferase-like n=1 Tax=Uloborus diversus TaxID=327109 RepID=UPI00240985CB|nr:peroxisomal carnitine O-octanoyltransferase-like [Uloborus diversus]
MSAAQSQVKDPLALPMRNSMYVSNSDKTFAHDELLPSLPVPSLKQTLEKYLDSVKSFASEEELEHTRRVVNDFEHGIGKELHVKLMERSKHHRNWLEKWWEDIAYLSQRSSLLPLCSMAGFTNTDGLWSPVSGSQLERAALYMHYQLQFWKLLREERLKPHSSHNVPWSMHQFHRYFNTVRVPGEIIDKLECFFHTESQEPSAPTHVVTLHRGHIFAFDAVDEYGDILIPPELKLQFQRIKSWCEENGPGSSVGALTTDDRTTWAKNREWLLQINPENEMHMETIDTALCVIVLDDEEPYSLTEIVKETLAGDVNNRWADKSVSNLMFKNGMFGLISDHTPFDGLVPVVGGHFVYSSLVECGGVWKGTQNVERDILPPRRLQFHLDDHIENAIQEAKNMYKMMVDDTDVFCQSFTQYGKTFLKPYNFHPETYAQFALQLAYYTMHGKPAATYVTASTRQFYHGRTETMRSCFPEVVEWVKAMIADTAAPQEKLILMHKAADKFKSLMKDCTENHGCDRHLLGLYMISVEEEMPVPELFTDPAWIKSGGSGNFVLSTSCCGFTPLGGCVMPMKEDGYGTFYNIENQRFTFTISAFNRCPETSAAKFYHHIERSLLNMQNLLMSAKL